MASEAMNTWQNVASAYHDKKVVDKIIEENSAVHVLIPHIRRIKLTPK